MIEYKGRFYDYDLQIPEDDDAEVKMSVRGAARRVGRAARGAAHRDNRLPNGKPRRPGAKYVTTMSPFWQARGYRLYDEIGKPTGVKKVHVERAATRVHNARVTHAKTKVDRAASVRGMKSRGWKLDDEDKTRVLRHREGIVYAWEGDVYAQKKGGRVRKFSEVEDAIAFIETPTVRKRTTPAPAPKPKQPARVRTPRAKPPAKVAAKPARKPAGTRATKPKPPAKPARMPAKTTPRTPTTARTTSTPDTTTPGTESPATKPLSPSARARAHVREAAAARRAAGNPMSHDEQRELYRAKMAEFGGRIRQPKATTSREVAVRRSGEAVIVPRDEDILPRATGGDLERRQTGGAVAEPDVPEGRVRPRREPHLAVQDEYDPPPIHPDMTFEQWSRTYARYEPYNRMSPRALRREYDRLFGRDTVEPRAAVAGGTTVPRETAGKRRLKAIDTEMTKLADEIDDMASKPNAAGVAEYRLRMSGKFEAMKRRIRDALAIATAEPGEEYWQKPEYWEKYAALVEERMRAYLREVKTGEPFDLDMKGMLRRVRREAAAYWHARGYDVGDVIGSRGAHRRSRGKKYTTVRSRGNMQDWHPAYGGLEPGDRVLVDEDSINAYNNNRPEDMYSWHPKDAITIIERLANTDPWYRERYSVRHPDGTEDVMALSSDTGALVYRGEAENKAAFNFITSMSSRLHYDGDDEHQFKLIAEGKVEYKGDGGHSGIMVALVPADDYAVDLTIPRGEKSYDLHTTLMYLPDASRYDSYTRDRIVQAVRNASLGLTRVKGKAFAASVFNPKGQDPCVVLGVSGKELTAAHRVVRENVINGAMVVPPSDEHSPWVPHITLGYMGATGKGALDNAIGKADGREVIYDRIRVAFGDEEKVDINLVGYEPPPLKTRLHQMAEGDSGQEYQEDGSVDSGRLNNARVGSQSSFGGLFVPEGR